MLLLQLQFVSSFFAWFVLQGMRGLWWLPRMLLLCVRELLTRC